MCVCVAKGTGCIHLGSSVDSVGLGPSTSLFLSRSLARLLCRAAFV